MGRIVDSLFVSLIAFAGFFAALLFCGKSAAACALMALFGAGCVYVLIGFVLEKTPRFSFHRRRTQAARRVRRLIYESAENAHTAVFDLLRTRYPVREERFEEGSLRFLHADYDAAALHVIQKLRVSPDDVLKAWREHGAGREIRALVVAVPGRSEADIRVLASRLTQPEVVILDRRQLIRLTRRTEKYEAPAKEARFPHPLRALKEYVTRRRAARYIGYALLMAGNYAFTGKVFYLVCGLLLADLGAFCLFSPGEPRTLIERAGSGRSQARL